MPILDVTKACETVDDEPVPVEYLSSWLVAHSQKVHLFRAKDEAERFVLVTATGEGVDFDSGIRNKPERVRWVVLAAGTAHPAHILPLQYEDEREATQAIGDMRCAVLAGPIRVEFPE